MEFDRLPVRRPVMRRGLAGLAVAMAMASPAPATAQEGWGQIMLNNQSTETADLFVNGEYACRALAGLNCTTQVRVGVHTLTARWPDGQTSTATGVELERGRTRTMTIQDSYR